MLLLLRGAIDRFVVLIVAAVAVVSFCLGGAWIIGWDR
jgi:hypothetical protein